MTMAATIPTDVAAISSLLQVVFVTSSTAVSEDHSHRQRSKQQVKAAVLPRGSSSSPQPRNMLLFSLGSSLDASVLRDEALSGVEKLTLIGHLSAEADRGSDALGVYTVLPFSSGVRLLGPWERESFSRWEALFPDRFPSFQGYTFHIASRLKDEPFFFPSVKDPLKRNGVGLDMMECLSAKLNFSYTATNNSPDSKWGASSNGVWDGVLGMVHRREKNFTINSFLLDINRSRDFDFSTPIHIDGFGVYLRSPDPLPNWMSFAKVFQGSVWLAVLFAFLASTCFTLLRVRRVSCLTNKEKYTRFCMQYFLAMCSSLQERVREGWSQPLERNRPTRGLATICLDIQRPLVAQSVPLLPAAVPLRILMALWFVHGLVITVAYTSNLVGIFTSPVYPRRLQDLQEIADSEYRSLSDTQARTVILKYLTTGNTEA
uniref:Ionotropic glutamate receptor L-glutamate and glycine-binding domain-containing protein n=1 Tax=Scylla olivacea TaxID=85551 RepID=A0A0P4VUC2_SCYOL